MDEFTRALIFVIYLNKKNQNEIVILTDQLRKNIRRFPKNFFVESYDMDISVMSDQKSTPMLKKSSEKYKQICECGSLGIVCSNRTPEAIRQTSIGQNI